MQANKALDFGMNDFLIRINKALWNYEPGSAKVQS